MSKKQAKQQSPFLPVTDVKDDPKSVKKYKQTLSGKDSAAAVRALLALIQLYQKDEKLVDLNGKEHEKDYVRCLMEIKDSTEKMVQKTHCLSLDEVKSMLDIIGFTSKFIDDSKLVIVQDVLKNFLCQSSHFECRKLTFEKILDIMRNKGNVTIFSDLFLPSLNLRSFIPKECENEVPTAKVSNIDIPSNVYCPADTQTNATAADNSKHLIELFFKRCFESTDTIRIFTPLFNNLVCAVLPNVSKIPSLTPTAFKFEIGTIPSRLYSIVGEEILKVAKDKYARQMLNDERFQNIFVQFFTEMPFVFKAKDKDSIKKFLDEYFHYFIIDDEIASSVLKDKLGLIQIKMIETSSEYFNESFLDKELRDVNNPDLEKLFENLINFFEKFGDMDEKLSNNLRNALMTAVTNASVHFLHKIPSDRYISHRRKLMNILFVLHIQWMQYEGDWGNLQMKIEPYYDLDILDTIENELEFLTTILCQKVYVDNIFEKKLPMEESEYITGTEKESYYEQPRSELKLSKLKQTWDVKRTKDTWNILFKFVNHPSHSQRPEIVEKVTKILVKLLNMFLYAEDNAELKKKEDAQAVQQTQTQQAAPTAQPAQPTNAFQMGSAGRMGRQSAWGAGKTWGQRGSFRPSSMQLQQPAQEQAAAPAQPTQQLDANRFSIKNSNFIDLQEVFLPVFLELVTSQSNAISENVKILSYQSVSKIVSRNFPLYKQEVYDIFTQVMGSILDQPKTVQMAFIKSTYNVLTNPTNSMIYSFPYIIELLKPLDIRGISLDEQVKLVYMLGSTIYLYSLFPNIEEELGKIQYSLGYDFIPFMIDFLVYFSGLFNQVEQEIRDSGLDPRPRISLEAKIMIGWLLVDLMIVILEMGIEYDHSPTLDVIFGGLSSTEFYEYTSSIEMISYLFTKSKLLPKTLIDDMVESLLKTVLEIPITPECTSEIFNLFSRLCVTHTNNFFTIIVKPETFVCLYNACKKVLEQYVEDSPERLSTYISPSVAVQKFLATAAQIVYEEPTVSTGLRKCGRISIPDESNAKFFAYGDSIVSILPLETNPDNKTTETRLFIRNMYGMYELVSTTVQTVSDLNNEYFVDKYVPIKKISWPDNKNQSTIPEEKSFEQSNLLNDLLDEIEKEDETLLMCEFPEEIMSVTDYFNYIENVETTMNNIIAMEQEDYKKSIDLTETKPRELEVTDDVHDYATEYLQNILNLYSFNDSLLKPIASTEQFKNDLQLLDKVQSRILFKQSVIYVGEQSFTHDKIDAEREGSDLYQKFMESIGWYTQKDTIVCDKTFIQDNRTGLLCYNADSDYEFVYEEYCLIDDPEAKKRSLKSSLIHIVWDECVKPYHPVNIENSTAEVVIVIKPNQTGSFGVRVFRKSGMPIVGPLVHNMIVPGNVFNDMLKQTIMNIHYHYLGNGYTKMDSSSHRLQHLMKLTQQAGVPKDYTTCKMLELILENSVNK